MTTSTLFEPITFREGARARNRIALAPLTNGQSAADGTLSEEEIRWLVRRAAGGFGVVTTAAAHVAQDGQGFDGQLGVFADELLPGLRRLGAQLGAEGALGIVQLHHGGVRAPSRLTGLQPWSASAFHEDHKSFEPPRAATEDDLNRVIGQFRDAARRSLEAGFGGVELHGAHGYLLSQFLSRTMNLRTDKWGGDLSGRARLVREVTGAVRAAVPAPFVVGVRLSPEDYFYARGLDLDETVQVARWLAEDGVDYIHLSLWDATANTTKRLDEHLVPDLPRSAPNRGEPVGRRRAVDGLRRRGAPGPRRGRGCSGPGRHRQPGLAHGRPRPRLGATTTTAEPRRARGARGEPGLRRVPAALQGLRGGVELQRIGAGHGRLGLPPPRCQRALTPSSPDADAGAVGLLPALEAMRRWANRHFPNTWPPPESFMKRGAAG